MTKGFVVIYKPYNSDFNSTDTLEFTSSKEHAKRAAERIVKTGATDVRIAEVIMSVETQVIFNE